MKRVLKVAADAKFWMGATALSAVFALATAGFAIINGKNETVMPPAKAASISGKKLTVSEQSKQDVRTFVQREDLVIATAIVTADLVKNKRATTYFFTKSAELQAVWDEYLTRRNLNVAVFSGDVDNERVANLINGSFDCRPFKETIGYSLYPAAEKYSPWLCALSIPAGFDDSGDFVGFLNVFLTREPTDLERKRFIKNAVDLSSFIYRRDVAQTQQK